MAYYLNLATDVCRAMRGTLFGYGFSCDFPKIVAATRHDYKTYLADSEREVPITIGFTLSDFTDFNGWFKRETTDTEYSHISTLANANPFNEIGVRWLRLIALTEVAVTVAMEDLARHHLLVFDPDTFAAYETGDIIEGVRDFRVGTRNPEMWDGTSENAEPQQQIQLMLEMVRDVVEWVLGKDERAQYVIDIIGTTYLGFDAPPTTWTATGGNGSVDVYLVVIGNKLSDKRPDECILLDNEPEMTTRLDDMLGPGAAHLYKLPVIPAVRRFVAKWGPLEEEGPEEEDPDFVRDFALVEDVYLNIIRFCDNPSVTSSGFIDKGFAIVKGDGGNTILLGCQN